MQIIIEFFRDTLSGIVYVLYLIFCIIAFFYTLGIVGDRKRKMIEVKLKEKKAYDIASGKEAAIAAMETKQVLDIDEADSQLASPEVNAAIGITVNNGQNGQQPQEEVPQVMVFDSNASSGQNAQQNQQQQNEPIVFDSSSN